MKNKRAIIFLIFTLTNLDTFARSEVNDKVTVEDQDYAIPVPVRSQRSDPTSVKMPRSRIVDAMLRTPSLQLKASESDFLYFTRDRYDIPKPFKGPLVEYDFIIVGAGSAGSVLASRLSEGRQWSVLVLEAGLGESLLTEVPILAPVFQRSEYVWPYLMEPQDNVCMGFEGQRCYWPRGKAVGGSTVINYMIYTRGQPADWDRISADGNYGWSYKEVLPYYKKSEKANLRGLKNSSSHGRDGELCVEYVPFRSRLSKAFLGAAKSLGNRIVDYNSLDGFGFNYIQATMSRGRRFSAAKAFLHDHKKRKNLHILSSAIATKIVIDPTTSTATGVEFTRNGATYRILAKKEVILSAGPIESPHLLMLSGIGPKEHLNSVGIPVIRDLKVGETLYDHISFPALTFTLNTSRLTIIEKNIANVETVTQYTQFGDGPMSTLAAVETIGYIRTNVTAHDAKFPDIELLGTCASIASDDGTAVGKGMHLSDWVYDAVYKPIENVDSFTIVPMLLHPRSKGHLKLRSRDPMDPPKLHGNYLTEREDVANMIAAIRYIIKLVDTPHFRKYGAKLHKRKLPNCKSQFNTDGYWECALRSLTATLHHQIATCKMGPESDPYAVVDPELRVYGVRNLRVVDSSVIPRTIAAHTAAPAIMIGEKAADMIRNTWR